ncbi:MULTISPECIES: SOS response-associated peptidase family protein [unclassified Microbacterium]|uniref:SOS response-associated peptidase family protein n=1 Tax=unclassified Microbacterium TaxID=2609290 RepID=UPI001D4E2006|nr:MULTISPECIES: SOS response-associated peptidase family protein [unclassified Microbacterium]CAH0192043.1 Putative SOS response-associated peptidase YedK [Microbacterium sp. Bi121]HWK78237.1 SOS response-associated peptidase family protein [Microbacterium sp.]
MCASYGLDPRFTDAELLAEADADILEGLREWAQQNDGETLRPTGKNLRNLNPVVVPGSGRAALEPAWWGYLIDGQPSRFPSINTRSERLQDRPGNLRTRAIVPTTGWFEMRKPERVWNEFTLDDGVLFGMAAVTQRGRTPGGDWVTCYSIVMAPAPDHLAEVHDRMPVLIPAEMSADWLTAEPGRELIDEALAASAEMAERISVAPRASDR